MTAMGQLKKSLVVILKGPDAKMNWLYQFSSNTITHNIITVRLSTKL
jgi:hypothetical protein